GDSVDIVWLRDRSRIAEMQAQLQEELASVIRQRDDLLCVLDLLPFPLWERNADLSLRYVNAAYARAVEMAPEDVLSRQVELGASAISDKGKSLARMARDVDRLQAESHHIVIGEERRLIEFSEMPVPNDPDGGRLLGIALDQTDLEGVQSQLSQHIAAHAEVFEQLSTAIVIYGPDKRISYFNDAYRTLSYLDRKFLQSAPTYEEEFEALREKRRLPEVADFVAYKKARLGMFRSLIGRHEELVYLPDGQTLRLVVTPHPFGGLMFAYEDVTDRLALESSYNTLNAVQRATLDNLYEGVAVFGSDGRLKLYNPVYARMWLLSDDDLQGDPHIAEIVDNSRGFFGDGMEWEEARRREIARVTDPRPHTGRMERADNSVLDYAVVPLPDGNVLLSYLDVTDSVRVEQALL
ncbi:MAG: PAS-domain containing protein, partial [Alphaproteobacteria bacterium]